MVRVFTFIALLLFCIPVGSYAQGSLLENREASGLKRDEMKINFHVAKHFIDMNYMNNRQALDNIINWIESVQQDSLVNIVSVEFCGAVSPEGSVRFNHWLSLARLSTLEKYVRKHIDLPERMIVRNDHYIAWSELDKLVQESDIANKEEILAIIRSENRSKGEQLDSRIADLKKLDNGVTWRKLFNKYFRNLRNAATVLVTEKSDIALLMERNANQSWLSAEPFTKAIATPGAVTALAGIAENLLGEPILEKRYMHLKTNLVGLALLSANLGVEFDLGRHFSFNLPVYYCALDYFTSTVKFRNFSVYPELRYWPKNNYKGFFIGPHMGFAYYNFAFDGDYRYQDKDGKTPTLGGGLTIGYRLPISKNGRWNIELAAGAGIYPLNYDLFHNEQNGQLFDTREKTRIGIDNATVGLSYRIPLKTVKK